MIDKNIWQFICDCLQQDMPVILLLVVASAGSSPGRVGFKMVVAENGILQGTIGGGTVEHRFVHEAQTKLKNRDFSALCQYQVHNPQAESNLSGMICGGMQAVAVYPCQPSKDLGIIKQLLQALEQKKAGVLQISPSGITLTLSQHNATHYQFQFTAKNQWQYEENIGVIDTAYIVGGGHVGLALSRILAMLDFHIVVLEARAELNTLHNNTDAHEKRITAFHQIGEYIPDGQHNYVFIVTPNHRIDELVLRQLLTKKLGYLGLMGSAAKINKIMQNLEKDGIPSAQLTKVHAPIGLPIKSHTPMEVAISIAAEVIAIKNSA